MDVFGACILLVTFYLIIKDRVLLERRTRAGPAAEMDARQKVIQALASITFIAIFIVSSLDHRLSWSRQGRGSRRPSLSTERKQHWRRARQFGELSNARTCRAAAEEQIG